MGVPPPLSGFCLCGGGLLGGRGLFVPPLCPLVDWKEQCLWMPKLLPSRRCMKPAGKRSWRCVGRPFPECLRRPVLWSLRHTSFCAVPGEWLVPDPLPVNSEGGLS